MNTKLKKPNKGKCNAKRMKNLYVIISRLNKRYIFYYKNIEAIYYVHEMKAS